MASAPTHWLKIAVKIAVLFGIYGELLANKQLRIYQKFDLSVNSTDFSSVIAAWYARKMGLPINMIICSCDEPGALWDFIHRDELNTSVLDCEARAGIEQLIHDAYGAEQTASYLEACSKNGVYRVPEELESRISENVFCSVVGKTRIPAVINSVYRTDAFLLDSGTAPAYGALQDYRAKCGSNTVTLLLSEVNPILEPDQIMTATGLSQDGFYAQCKKV